MSGGRRESQAGREAAWVLGAIFRPHCTAACPRLAPTPTSFLPVCHTQPSSSQPDVKGDHHHNRIHLHEVQLPASYSHLPFLSTPHCPGLLLSSSQVDINCTSTLSKDTLVWFPFSATVGQAGSINGSGQFRLRSRFCLASCLLSSFLSCLNHILPPFLSREDFNVY